MQMSGESNRMSLVGRYAGILAAFALSVVYGVLIAEYTFFSLTFVTGLISLIVALFCLLDTRIGFFITLFYSFFIFHFSRLFFQDRFPVGLVSDLLILVTFLSLFFSKIDWSGEFSSFMKHSIVIWIIVLLFYLVIEVFNPYAGTIAGWVQTIRKFVSSILLLFISYVLFDKIITIKLYIRYLFICLVIVAVYGCIQQWHGLFDFELYWVMSDKVRLSLLFINGDFRKFSTTSSPSTFGIIMALGAVFLLIYILNTKGRKRYLLFGGMIVMLLGMAYSGTRTAYAAFLGGVFFYILISWQNVSTRIFSIASVLFLVVFLYFPYYGNNTINRIRSTFIGKRDKSFEVRELNRKAVQPYVYSHPFGGGLGTTGDVGIANNPGHFLAGFPPDSGYLKKALETGWIGLIIICILYYKVLVSGVHTFLRTTSSFYKIISCAVVCCIFGFYIAEIAQDAMGQVSDMVIYYPFLAILIRLNQLSLHA